MIYVLDTNAVWALMKGSPAVVERLAATAPAEVAIPQPVLAEIAFGIERLPRSKRRALLQSRFELVSTELHQRGIRPRAVIRAASAPPAPPRPATETSFASRRDRTQFTPALNQSVDHARLTENVAATSSASPLASHARTTRPRKSIDYGAIATSAEEDYHDRRTTYKSKTL